MYETEKRLFGQALADAISQKLDEELRECKETAACSRVHRKCIQYMIRYGESPKARKISKPEYVPGRLQGHQDHFAPAQNLQTLFLLRPDRGGTAFDRLRSAGT